MELFTWIVKNRKDLELMINIVILFNYGNIHRNVVPHIPCRRTFIPVSVSLWNDVGDPVFDGVGLAGFKSRANAFLLSNSCSFPFCVIMFSLSLLSLYVLVLWGWDLRTERVLIALSEPCIANLFNNIDVILYVIVILMYCF